MANAKSEDAQAAWSIFKDSKFTATLEQINGELGHRGYNPIAERTYRHLHKLERFGYDRYVPTNQLDVETLRDPVWDTPLRSRYLARRTELDVILIVVHGDELLAVAGQMIELSELEAVISFGGTAAGPWLAKPGSILHKSGLIVLTDSDDAKPVTIERIEPTGEAKSDAVVVVKFLGVISPRRIGKAQALPTTTLTLVVHVDNSEYLLNTVRSLNAVTAAVESVRIGCDEVLRYLDPNNEYVLTPPEIVGLSRENPIHLALSLPEKVAGLFIWLLRSVTRSKLELAQAGAIGSQSKGNEAIALATANIDNAWAERIREDTRTRRLINDAIEQAPGHHKSAIAAVFVREMASSLESSAGETPEVPKERLDVLAEKQIYPAIVSLGEHPINEVEAEADAEVPHDDLWNGDDSSS